MATAGQLEWRRAFPVRPLRRLGWFLLGAAVMVVTVWVLFGAEPRRLTGGELNPLALIPPLTAAAVAVAALPPLVALVRRPLVATSHYALTLRPGAARTLVLPWAGVAEIAGVRVRDEPLLLVRCAGGRLGDRPRWPDRSVLRAAVRAAGARRSLVGAYDLAVRMDEFVGDPSDQLVALADRAPGHVLFFADGL
jgi:hypothetical protein